MMLANEWALGFSAASLPLSLLALWRCARSQTLVLRTQLRQEVAGLRVTMDELIGRINRALPPRDERAHEAPALRLMRTEADADTVQLEALRGRLSEINIVPPFCSYNALEAKYAVAQAIRTRVRQVAEKYPATSSLFGHTGDPAQDHPAWRAVTTRQ